MPLAFEGLVVNAFAMAIKDVQAGPGQAYYTSSGLGAPVDEHPWIWPTKAANEFTEWLAVTWCWSLLELLPASY
jgi:hypothetical protein